MVDSHNASQHVKSRPILFSAPMARAALAGKVQS